MDSSASVHKVILLGRARAGNRTYPQTTTDVHHRQALQRRCTCGNRPFSSLPPTGLSVKTLLRAAP
eukprot:15482397-Alexandrium_andersonii.AAC.1